MTIPRSAKKLQEEEYAIFPCVPNTKAPLTRTGFKEASNDPEIIGEWWHQNPTANIGLPTGTINNLVVVDVDVKNGANGIASLDALQEQVGSFETYSVSTPSGGYHYYFNHPNEPVKNRVNFRDGIDIRGDGGYVLAVGSVIDGTAYTEVEPIAPIAPLPDKLRSMLVSKEASNDASFEPPPEPATNALMGIKEGSRNHELFRLASMLVGQNTSYEQAKMMMLSSANLCSPPLEAKEALQILDSAYSRYEPNINLTDSGNADRLVRLYGDDLRYVVEFGKWVIWGGNRWVFDEVGMIMQLTENTIKQMASDAQSQLDNEYRRKLTSHSLKSESQRAILAMESLARTKKGIPIQQSELDTNTMLLGVANGVLDLNTGLLRDDDAKDELITKQATVEFFPEATCPQWEAFIEQITGGDTEYAKYIQSAVGYSLTGKTTEQVLFFLYGIGANGKSTFVNTIQKLLGDYGQQSSSATFMASKRGAINNDVARLRGSRFVATTETEEGSRFDESNLKLLTGGDKVTARFLHKEHFEFSPEFKLWISGNHKPYIKGNDEGIWRRIKLLPFAHCIAPEDQDKELPRKLSAELSGILNWALEGCIDWQRNGLGSCSIVDSSTSAYRIDMDIIQSWIDECSNASPNHKERASELFRSYKHWATENCEWQMSERVFSRKLIEKGLTRGRDNKGSFYTGLKLNLRGDFL